MKQLDSGESRTKHSMWQQLRLFKVLCFLLAFSFTSTTLLAQSIPEAYTDGKTADWNDRSNPRSSYIKDAVNAHDDDQFTQGSKDADEISEWRWSPGNVNDKGDITNAGAQITDNNCILRFFGDRTSPNGSAAISFWFFVNPVGKKADGTFSGEHTNGDILIISDFVKGGKVAEFSAYMWMNGALQKLNTDNVDWGAAVNGEIQPVPAGLSYASKDKKDEEGMYPVNTFFEGALNLCQLKEANPGMTTCFSSFMMQTRNSHSINASLQDLAGGNFNSTLEAPVVVATQPTCTVATGVIVVTSATAGLEFSLNGAAYAAYPVGGYMGLAPGDYTLQVRNADGCSSALTTIKINAPLEGPNANAGADMKLTCTTTSVTLNGSSTTEGATFAWVATDGGNIVSGANTATPVVNAAGTYTLTVTANGCTATDVAVVTGDASVPEVEITMPAGAPVLKCTSTSVLLGSRSNIENGVYTWAGPNGFTSNERGITVTVAGTYVLTVTDPATGCAASASITISAPIYPELNAGPDKVLTCTSPTVTLQGSMDLYGTNSLRWVASDGGNIVSGETTLNPVVDAPGTYTMIVRHVTSACEATDVVVVTRDVTMPNVSAKGGTLSCETGSLQLMGASSTAGVTYAWTGPDNFMSSAQNPTVTVAGEYTLTVSLNGCSASATVTVYPQGVVSEPVVTCHTMGFSYTAHEKGLVTTLNTPEGPVSVMGRKRNPDGSYATQNHAALFDTQAPTGDDTDLYTTDWGLALIINQDQTNVPNDNQYGGELMLDFSQIGPVTMKSLKALDIDDYEGMSWVYLYDGEGNELYKVQLQNLGDNSKQDVNLGNTKGVMRMKVVLDGRNGDDLAGSGAIDEIEFCVEEMVEGPCVDQTAAVSISDAKAFPTPFTEKTTIEFKLQKAENYVVNLYDTQGNLIGELKAGRAQADEVTRIEVAGKDLQEGLYLARIVTESGAKTVKLLLKK